MTIHWKAVEQYFTAFTQFVILEHLSILDFGNVRNERIEETPVDQVREKWLTGESCRFFVFQWQRSAINREYFNSFQNTEAP